MTLKTIRETIIQRLFPPALFKRGFAYYKNDCVQQLIYDRNYDVWTASVEGTESYFVEVKVIDADIGLAKNHCDCLAFEAYGQCKHIVAVLLKMADEFVPSSKSTEKNYQATNRFIEAITIASQDNPALESLPQKEAMHVEYLCKWSYDQSLFIEMKTGVKRCYVIKDVRAFLENVLQGNEQYFTKTFTYNPDTHYFLKQDLDLFELLFSVYRNEQIYQRVSFNYYHANMNEKRSVIIPPLAVKQLLELLSKRDFTVEMPNMEYKHIEVVHDLLPFDFGLSKNEEDDLIFQMGDTAGRIYFKPYQILFSEGTFYFPSREQIPIIEEISELGMQEYELPIAKHQADQFLSEVLPSLKKIGNVRISESVEKEIIQLPLKAKLYLEMKETSITGKLEYHYGTEEINPFNGRKENDVIIIRDVAHEQNIMRLIEYANFHYNGKELYIDIEDENTLFDFIYHVLPLFNDYVELFLTNEIRGLMIENELVPTTYVQVESETNLLEIGFNIEGINKEELAAVLQAVIEKKRFYRMDTGELMSLEGEGFTSMKQFFDELEVNQTDVLNGNLHIPIYRGTQIDELIDTKKLYDPSFRKLLHQLRAPEEQVYELPENLEATLRSYQLTGYQWFKSLSAYHLGGILADDMGLGKTLQSIAYILSEPSDRPHLIVAPSSVIYNWKNECEKFAPTLKTIVLTGSPLERKKEIEESKDVDVWITSYATLRQDIELYQEITFQTMILDEAQYIKNYQTKTSQAIRLVRASRRFALSGTPIENSIDELWAIFQVVLPGLMPSQRKFNQLAHDKIERMTRPFILRRLKKDVLKELPDKIESVYVSELTKEQKSYYVGYLQRLQQEATESLQVESFQQNRMKILAGLTRLRQICCHPSLFIENYHGKSGKLEQLLETIETSIANGNRMLIFSQFTSMHEIIIEELKKRDIGHFYLHGQTDSKTRVEMSDRFNEGEHDVFLISLKAGGTGLNLTGADTVILYDLWWNPAVEDQATGRAHRFGQKKVVQVIRMIAEGTIEEKIYALQQKKRALIDQVIQPGETMLSGLTEDDIRELLSI